MRTNKQNAQSKNALMKQLQIYQFSILETALYLDTHPHDPQALAYYNKIKKAYEEALDTYQTEYGPLSIGGNMGKEWQWIDGPWPWETEAN